MSKGNKKTCHHEVMKIKLVSDLRLHVFLSPPGGPAHTVLLRGQSYKTEKIDGTCRSRGLARLVTANGKARKWWDNHFQVLREK